jgi:TM2 domain-containing membrane protein YozV
MTSGHLCRPSPIRMLEMSSTTRESRHMSTTGQGSAGNVIAAVCSFFLPGLGQLVQGRVLGAIMWFLLACVIGGLTFVFTLGLLPFGWGLVAILSCIDAAIYKR